MNALSGAGKLEANQPPNSLTERDAQRIPPAASGLAPADLRGAGDDPAAASIYLQPTHTQSRT